jgi:nucleotide-binding universal stress UspA family protein
MFPLSSILVPLDGSRFAEQALPLAERLARSSSACLRLALVHTPSASWDPGVEFSLFDPEMEQQLRERELNYLESLAGRLMNGGGLHVECALLTGSVAEALEDYVERTGTDLVLMTSHGRGGIGRLVLGNVADQLVLRLDVPVLVIRPEEKKAAARQPEIQRILVPLDGSPVAETVLEEAKAFARLTGAELILASIVQPIPVLLPPFVWPPVQVTESPVHRVLEARHYLEKMKGRLRKEGFKVQTRVRCSPKVAREILEIAREQRCNLITMATHGAGGLDRLMLGSVADQVVRHSDLPVLVLRSKANQCMVPVAAGSAEDWEPGEACRLM